MVKKNKLIILICITIVVLLIVVFVHYAKLHSKIYTGLDEYMKKLEQYKHLKKGDIASISDDELSNAVIAWMWGKFNDDWTDEYIVISSLPKPCQNVYACCTVYDEVNNGGLNQFFFNSSGQFANMAKEGFLSIGSEKLSKTMLEAIEIYKRNEKLLEKYDDGTVKGFSESYDEKLFDELDDEFYNEESTFNSLLIEYIRKNENAFGD